jgi:hypothetical protein
MFWISYDGTEDPIFRLESTMRINNMGAVHGIKNRAKFLWRYKI